MIALDTNILVRYLVADEPRQTAEAARVIDAATAAGEPLFIGQIVICELVWVLSFAYDVPRREIASILQQLRRASNLLIDSPDQVQRAIESFENGKGDLADYLIAEHAMAQGCSSVATFDRVLYSDPRFIRPA